MGNIKVILSDEMEEEFREEVFRQMGMKKGNIKIAIDEAIKEWVVSRRKKAVGQPQRQPLPRGNQPVRVV